MRKPINLIQHRRGVRRNPRRTDLQSISRSTTGALFSLALRNGSSLHPFYMPGMHSLLQQAFAMMRSKGCQIQVARGKAIPLYTYQEIPIRNVYIPADQFASSSHKFFMPVTLDSGKSDRPFSLDPSTTAHCRPFGFTISNKHLYGDSKLQQLQLDVNRCEDESSSGVSS